MKLYMVSLGPGDYELITVKALKALKQSDAICIPTKSADNSFVRSMTYKIVKKLMDEFGFDKPIIPMYSPMKFQKEDWQRQVDIIYNSFNEYKTLSFVTLGDSAVYSTVYYLLDLIKEQNITIYKQCEVIPGVTSFSHASAKVKKPLCVGDSSFLIRPLHKKKVPFTTVYMRPKIGMSTENIKNKNLIYTFENLNYKEEQILDYKKQKVDKYMTLFIDFLQ
ncbi:precorrin-2 C(20)-methyltransferase [Malaciobacter mytili]|uniref:Cobalt-precorrin-2 C(20)-methyltransferase n=1 Tax=Malaciobacter mytili LMG 24559 TaxID=1032238 RepID=A0AAX2AG57_9BACT|nr:precorrin-2 C(20)-methyltransferase [Malaciobacter mytili]AXH15126.1 cobalt-sirohydrochlorin (C20)-methyltransferase [Malaciobacter mytili LMG 24559]RXI44391.1 cobalt-precorrin-2 C(20)-methyltransferase [Malaciobacter mytili]RXK15635.1 cobalt-precorrin-2 C(20)-methyltransferase [Malaciobacter mytili LMG 24559]